MRGRVDGHNEILVISRVNIVHVPVLVTNSRAVVALYLSSDDDFYHSWNTCCLVVVLGY